VNDEERPLFGQYHVDRYRETDGAVGHDWLEGAPVALLTTVGRRSGEERTTPLIYGRRDDDVILVASDGGNPKHPPWYLNLQANPEVGVQIWGEKFRARARDATPEERPELWRMMNGRWQYYDRYQEMAEGDREIPVVVLERIDSD
jgi:deazaflavin-dependent oxidoreductase (nitroreductase family)